MKVHEPQIEIPTSNLGYAVKEARQRHLPIVKIKNRYVVTSAPRTLMRILERHGLGTSIYPLKPLKAKRKRASSWPW